MSVSPRIRREIRVAVFHKSQGFSDSDQAFTSSKLDLTSFFLRIFCKQLYFFLLCDASSVVASSDIELPAYLLHSVLRDPQDRSSSDSDSECLIYPTLMEFGAFFNS